MRNVSPSFPKLLFLQEEPGRRVLFVFMAFILGLLAQSASAQSDSAAHVWQSFFYEWAANDEGSDELDEEAYETLCEMESRPINLNSASRDELSLLPFLTERQIEDIHEYLYTHGPMRSMAELMAITSLDYHARKLLACFVYLGEAPRERAPSLAETLRHTHGSLLLSGSIPTYTRKGDDNGYLGYRFRHSFRLELKATDRLMAGFSGSQDAGEPFFAYQNKLGYDHYAYFVQLRHTGILDNLILGHFNLQWGMGLVANGGMMLGKSASLSSMGRVAFGFRPTASRASSSYFQGVAATLRLGHYTSMSLFGSWRPHDGTLNSDGVSVANLTTSGYHRTTSELSRKNNLHSTSAGLHLEWRRRGFHVGASALYTRLSRTLQPSATTLYRRYYPQGRDFLNASIHYGYCSPLFTLSGETATDRQGRIATINSIALSLPGQLQLLAIGRYYPKAYSALHARSFSEGGRVQNEQGLYLGAQWQPTSTFSLSAYADYARFPWARYRVSRSSDAFDAQLASSLRLWGRLTVAGRYRLRLRYRNNSDATALTRYDSHQSRLSLTYAGEGWTTTTQAHYTVVGLPQASRGYMLLQQAAMKWRFLQASLSVAYFHTDDYDSRIYAYERGPLYSFGLSSYSGQGLRTMLMLRADLFRCLMLTAKLGFTRYYDRQTIGTGLQQITSPNKSDIDLQARWKF